MTISARYRAAEREMIRDFALSVYSNASASADERASAYERLLESDAGIVDPKLLTTDELRTYVQTLRSALPLYNKARGLIVRAERKPSRSGPGYAVDRSTPEPKNPWTERRIPWACEPEPDTERTLDEILDEDEGA